VTSSVHTLGRYAVIALVLVIGVVGLSLCADAHGAECDHLCCRGASHSAPLERIVRRAVATFGVTAALALPLFALTSSSAPSVLEAAAPSFSPLGLAPLRI